MAYAVKPLLFVAFIAQRECDVKYLLLILRRIMGKQRLRWEYAVDKNASAPDPNPNEHPWVVPDKQAPSTEAPKDPLPMSWCWTPPEVLRHHAMSGQTSPGRT